MTVLYSDRSAPLSVNAANTAFSNNIALAWDFTGIGALAEGAPWKYAGATSPTLVKTGTQAQTTLSGEPSRVSGASAIYDYNPGGTTDYGWQVGTGDFTIGIRFNTSSAALSARSVEVLRISGSAGTALSVVMFEDSAVGGWYATLAGSTAIPMGSAVGAVFYPANTSIIVWVQKVAGVVTVYTQNATTQTALATRYAAGAAASAPMDSTRGVRTIINFGSGAMSGGLASVIFWNVGHSAATMLAIGKDYWSTQTNTAVADAIAITSPTASSTIAATSVISGTYTGTAPTTGVEVQFGANAWVAGTGMTVGSGTWSGTFALTAGGPSTLQAREVRDNLVLSATVASVTVSANAISFAGSGLTTDEAVAFRVFQRNGSNQATVRLKGTYVGTVTNIEYSFDGGAWATLVAAPTGGTFNATVTLTGPAQGALSVRFSNNTAVIGTLSAVGVGEVYMVAGQSNHVGGGGGTYVPAVAPGAHPSWKPSILDKTGVWRENVETSTDPFSKTTNASVNGAASATYAVQATSATATNSYFGKLATLFMAAGVPVAFVPSAMGSTNIASWAPSTATTTLYGAMLARATALGVTKVLWWQGEQNCTDLTTRTSYEASLNALINDWCVTRFAGAKWVLMNLNVTGNTVGTGGTTGTDTGFNAIHAAIAAVAASNSNVFGIADMNGAFSSSIHYATAPEIAIIADRAYAAMVPTVVAATTVTITLQSRAGVNRSNLTGLKWAFFDQMPGSFTAPVVQGAVETTDASGVLVLNITGTTLLPSAVGWLTITNSNGTVNTSDYTFSGPVAVA